MSDLSNNIEEVWDLVSLKEDSTVNIDGMFPAYSMCFASLNEAQEAVDWFIKSQSVPYIVGFKEKKFGITDVKDVIKSKSQRIMWKSKSVYFNNSPFVFIGRKCLYCHQGRDGNKAKKLKLSSLNKWNSKAMEEAFQKLGCPATITMYQIAVFSKFKIENEDFIKDKRAATNKIRQLLAEDLMNELGLQQKFYVSFPSSQAHSNDCLQDFISFNLTKESSEEKENREKRELIEKCKKEIEDLNSLININQDNETLFNCYNNLHEMKKILQSNQKVIHLHILTSPVHETDVSEN